jgi:hypothetical protein
MHSSGITPCFAVLFPDNVYNFLFSSARDIHTNIATWFPSGKSFFLDAETVGFLSGNEEFFLLARKSINYEEAYLNTVTNNCAD